MRAASYLGSQEAHRLPVFADDDAVTLRGPYTGSPDRTSISVSHKYAQVQFLTFTLGALVTVVLVVAGKFVRVVRTCRVQKVGFKKYGGIFFSATDYSIVNQVILFKRIQYY